MKNFVKWFGIIALVAVIGFSFASCGGDGSGPAPKKPTSVTYTSTDGTDTYVLTIIKGSANRAVYNPQKCDNYELKVDSKTSKGTVDKVSSDGKFELKPTGSTETFKATISGGNMTAIEGTINFTDGSSMLFVIYACYHHAQLTNKNLTPYSPLPTQFLNNF